MRIIFLLIAGITFFSNCMKAQPLAHVIPLSWTAETMLFSKSSKWEYFLGEDNDFIYLGMLIPPGKEAQQMLMTGMTVWIGKKEAHKNAIGVRFPLGFPDDERPETAQELKTMLFNWHEKEETVSASFTNMELINKSGKMDTLLGPASTVGGVGCHMVFEEGYWIYELILPKSIISEQTKEMKKQNVIVMTGALSRPRDLQGTDAVGFANSQLYRMGSGGKRQRERISDVFYFSDFTEEVKNKIKKVNLNLSPVKNK